MEVRSQFLLDFLATEVHLIISDGGVCLDALPLCVAVTRLIEAATEV
jgi:hypothetical protein